MGRAIHFEVAAGDVQRASDFYSSVFDWEINETIPGQYWLMRTGLDAEPGIDGAILKRSDTVRQGKMKGFVCTIQVDDIVGARKKIKAAGGKLISKILPVPGLGRYCYCTDTEGNSFGMLQLAG